MSADFYREVLAIVREALDVPEAATVDGFGVRDRLLETRVSMARVVLGMLLDQTVGPSRGALAGVRRCFADRPIGYVTADQVDEAMATGMSRREAIEALTADHAQAKDGGR